jgi:hypothetical protein
MVIISTYFLGDVIVIYNDKAFVNDYQSMSMTQNPSYEI